MFFFHQERRQEAHDGILRAVEEDALGQACIHNGARRNLELDALNESAAAHSDRRRRFPTKSFSCSCKYAPTLLTFSRSFSSSTIARNSSATRHARGPPPNVVPCCPGEIADANSSLAMNAPSGKPAAIGLAIATMSGVTPKLWNAKIVPVRPKPH